jgi:hypothetical protein
MAGNLKGGKKREIRREQLWPCSAPRIWPPQDETGGWGKVPRILPVLLTVIDQSGTRKKNESISQTYVELLCRNMGEGIVEVPDEDEAAVLSGFTGTRRVRSWQERIAALVKLKLIEVLPVGGRKIGAILMLEPRPALEALRVAGQVADNLWSLVQKRYLETRTFDIRDPLKFPPIPASVVVPINRPRAAKRPLVKKA